MTYRLLSVALTSLAIVVSCSPAEETMNTKNSFSEYEIVNNKQIPWSDVLSQKEKNYIVFIYTEKCGYCHDMMSEIIAFAEDDIMPTYFVDALLYDIPISADYEAGMTKYADISIAGTPTILEIYDATLIANIPGIDWCLSFLNEKRKETNIIL